MLLSVILCSHNPKTHYLLRTLAALREQTLDKSFWELLLIDNASLKPLHEQFDLTWHPMGRHAHVCKLGKTHALTHGIKTAQGDVLIIVDDDNVLDSDYLANARNLFMTLPSLGVVGGKIEGEFEIDPPEWIKPYLLYLAIIDFGDTPFQDAVVSERRYIPPGAGMVIRKTVAANYVQQIKEDPIRQRLDPVGNELLRCGDTDMALCALDMGLAKGYYPQLKLTHLIPKERLELKYMQRLMKGSEYSSTLLSFIRGLAAPRKVSFWQRYLLALKWRIGMKNASPSRLLEIAIAQGNLEANLHYINRRAFS